MITKGHDMHKEQQQKRAEEMYELYLQGHSLAQVAKLYGVTRQTIYGVFKRRRFQMRQKRFLPYVIFNNKRYTPDPDGYYRKTDGNRSWLHQDVWRFHGGEIPDGWHIHHKDKDKSNNSIENLECLSPSDHAQIHHFPREIDKAPLCLFCGVMLERHLEKTGKLEVPAAVKRRLYCNTKCRSKHRIGKPRKWKATRCET